MGLYENMLILRPEMEPEEETEVLNDLQETIVKNGGSVVKVVDWQKRKLAYEINKIRDGHYYIVYFDAPGTIIPEVEHFFRVTDSIMRFMIVTADESDLEAVGGKEHVQAAGVEEAAAEEETTAADETDVNKDEHPVEKTAGQAVSEEADQPAAEETDQTAAEEADQPEKEEKPE